ncbi:hypothetical protein GCM10010177_79920 [Actinomadura citrea]|nr:hypothetical protein GCM10010177_79920 [Actinomadura citrea]
MRFDSIPMAETAPEGAVPSRIRALIPNPPASRRTMIRGLGAAALAATLVPYDWVSSRRAARAEPAPTSEWLDPHCGGGGIGAYTPAKSNWWTGDPDMCVGGWRVGSKPCNHDSRHFDGFWEYTHDGIREIVWAQRTPSFCAGRNSWRWSAPDGNTFRCSDAWTHISWADNEYAGLTIAVCFVGVMG